MSEIKRSSDVVEGYSEQAIMYGIGGLVAIGIGVVMIIYQGMLMYLGWLLAIGGFAAVCYAVYELLQIRKVPGVSITCPYCSASNRLTEAPDADFRCTSCDRAVPVLHGKILEVFQVRCGFCNHLNYYSTKSEGLICEDCNREIPIAVGESGAGKKFFQTYTRQDDETLYELVLEGYEHRTEELIGCLQQMLALNRNQVKDILDELPTVLLTGIPKKKAEMLSAQLSVHHALSTTKPVG